jgi:hypothetical protein
MGPELLSTARPSKLRLAGFATLTLGGVLLGVGALLTWATVGFPGDLQGTLDVKTKGVDVWEGEVALAIGVATLVGMIVMRLLRSARARRGVAVAILVAGLGAAALVASDALRADSRFGGSGGLDAIAHRLATRLGQPYPAIRIRVEKELGRVLRVDLGFGMFLAIAGGISAAAGGALSIAWARARQAAPAGDTPAPPLEPPVG